MNTRSTIIPWRMLLSVGLAVGGLSLSSMASADDDSSRYSRPSCTISPQNPKVNVEGSISWSASYSGFWRTPSYSWKFSEGDPSSSERSSPTVKYSKTGTYTTQLELKYGDTKATCTTSVTVGGTTTPPPQSSAYSVLAANDLGMHCADLDYQVFSILPPFNVVHAQVIKLGTGTTATTRPQLLTDNEVDVVYSAVSSDFDPKGPGSINTTSDATKTNFWQLAKLFGQPPAQIAGHENTLGGLAYAPLYPSVLAGVLLEGSPDFSGFCNKTEFPDGCPSILNLFEPLAGGAGLPVPDLHKLFPESGSPVLAVGQQKMPGPLNTPQHFDRFDVDLPFFVDFPFGYRITDANWFAADGIPILPIDDSGKENAYPLMRVQAVVKDQDPKKPENVLASVDVVLPVASEADCQTCHASKFDAGNGAATEDASVTFDVMLAEDAPGSTDLNKLQNAAKINILRLHDAKHWDKYEAWDANGQLVSASCDATDSTDPNCLANQTPVQCSQCHYSPALDLAQAGPVDEPDQGPRGRQQRHHISQSRAMHGHHGQFTALFPEMPPPNDPLRTADQEVTPVNKFELGVLQETCYSCHPGKNTKCLRGAMFAGGMVCQDCHGNMKQVGNDFTADFASTPFPDGADMTKRVPWANEPGCQSCHTGDAVSNLTADHPQVVAPDGIRLLQAYTNGTHQDGSSVAVINQAAASRFAENQDLYRLSQGHGGVKCEGCHGSTHAIWPVTPTSGPFVANDNLAAMQLQGHTGTVSECSTCHAAGSLPADTLGGPHGMHLVNDRQFYGEGHEDLAEAENGKPNGGACAACHGKDHKGTVLSRAAADRTFRVEGGTRTVKAGEPVGCGLCHSLSESFER